MSDGSEPVTATAPPFVGEHKPQKNYETAMTAPWRGLAGVLALVSALPVWAMLDSWSDERAVFYGTLLGFLGIWVFVTVSLALLGYVVLGPADWGPQIVEVQAPPVVLAKVESEDSGEEPRVRVLIRTRRYLRLSAAGPFRVLAALTAVDLLVPLWLLLLEDVRLSAPWHNAAIAVLVVLMMVCLLGARGRIRVKLPHLPEREELRLERSVRGVLD